MSDTTRVSEALARPVRTAVQFIPSAVVTEFIDAIIWNMDERQYAAVLALLTLVFGYFQVLIENKTGYALFRKFTRTAPAVLSTPTTPLTEGTDTLPGPVREAQGEA